MMASKTRIKIGDIVQIPLSDGRFVAGRIYKEASIGIYKRVFDRHVSMSDIEHLPTAFVIACFDTAIKDGTWLIIGNMPFAASEDSWAPPRYIQDIINPDRYRIYHKGKMHKASKDETNGLEKAQIYKPEQLIERILSEVDEGWEAR